MILLSFLFNVLILILAAVGARIHFSIEGWAMFQYYTLCSNLFLLAACAVQAWYEGGILLGRRLYVPSWVRVLKYFAVCTVTVTFFVVLFILMPMYGGLASAPWFLLKDAMLYHHLLCPVLGFLSFVFVDRAALPDRRVTLWALVPTLVYACISTALNAVRVLDGPYPFLRVHAQPLWASVLWFALILAVAWGLAFLVWKLSLRFSAPREEPPAIPEAAAWTEDGYIKDQDGLSAYPYRTIHASDNGCGPVAAFDLRRFAGQDVRFPDVLAEMEGMHLLRVPGPTFLYVMRRYLAKYLPGFHEVSGREAALAAAEKSRMGVLRYYEEMVLHFIPYYRVEPGRFRFFNVSDAQEDFTSDWAAFAAGHLRGGSVRLIYWE